ncbi:MAG TPA: transcriptional regulator [Planctomycetota bacterium]|nr:transcriptional regulator [Planctomycetota bacterium]
MIKTETEYNAALERASALMDASAKSPEAAELELLATLLEAYESRRYPIGPPDPIEAIKFRMDQAGLKQKDLTPYIGSRSKVSEVLNHKRPLSLRMIRALHKGLGIPAESLLAETHAGKKRRRIATVRMTARAKSV